MSVAIPIPLLQLLPDVNVTPAVGVDEYALTYDHDTARFVLRAPFAGLLASGATVGATAQAQAFTLGVVSPFSAPAADSTTAFQVRKADKTTSILNVDTTNERVGIGTTSPGLALEVNKSVPGDYIAEFRNSNAIGVGLRLWNATDANASLTITNAAGSADKIQLFGDGKALFQGNVGINTTTPATALHVVGAATITGGIRPAADGTTALQLQTAAGTSVLNVDTVDGWLGIGTTTPVAQLTLSTATPATLTDGFTNLKLIYLGGAAAYSAGAQITFAQNPDSNYPTSVVRVGAIRGLKTSSDGAYGGGVQLLYQPNSGADMSPGVTLDMAGNVGVGTILPATRLDIDAGALTMAEMTAPTGVANKAMLYAKDNGSGKTQICCKLGDDVEIILATQS